jgi:hypothetical protein
VFMAEQVRFDAIGTVPPDAVGAPVPPPDPDTKPPATAAAPGKTGRTRSRA